MLATMNGRKLCTHNGHAWTTPDTTLPDHFSTYSTNTIGFPTLLSKYVFSLNSSRSNITISMSTCGMVVISLSKYFRSPVSKL